MTSMYLFTIILCVHVVYGQTKYCCYPDKWEGTEGIISGSADDEGHGSITSGDIMISMDATQQAIYSREYLSVGGQTKQFDVLQLYAQNSQYIIDDGKCTRTVIGKWTPDKHCVPDIAVLKRQFYLGNSQMLSLTEYTVNVSSSLKVDFAVTDDCVPATERVHGNSQGTNVFTTTGFFNITAGIKDPSVFNVPAICKSAPVGDKPIYRRRRSLISTII